VARFLDFNNRGVTARCSSTAFQRSRHFHHVVDSIRPDRMLYVTHGEQTEPDDAQETNNLNCKILHSLRRPPRARQSRTADESTVLKGVRNPSELLRSRRRSRHFTENGSPTATTKLNLLGRRELCWSTSISAQSPCARNPRRSSPFSPTIAPTGAGLSRYDYTPSLDGKLSSGSYNYAFSSHGVRVLGAVDQVSSPRSSRTVGEPIPT
jgi:hypothetical protein